MFENIRAAFASIWSNKLRSLLTLLGVVIGVSSVTILVALGQGLKNDVSGLIQGFGTNVAVVVAGKIDTKGNAGTNPANFVSGDILTLADVAAIQKVPDVAHVAPVSLVPGNLKTADQNISAIVFGTTPNFLDSLQLLSLGGGRMFSDNDTKVIVLGNQTKQQLFGDGEALGKTVNLGSEDLTVVGVLAKPAKTTALSSEYDAVSIIPFDEAKVLNKGQTKIARIIVKASDSADMKKVKSALHQALLTGHAGEEDFTVLTQDDILSLFDQFLNLATAMVSAIAGISLVVGGIGIMNIMLVTVTERTREIGLRKAVGATRGAILLQFLTEAIVVTLVGGLIGLGVAFAVAQVIALKTPLKPEFSLTVIELTVAISVVIGSIFGLWPALRAAKKDPIEALRYE